DGILTAEDVSGLDLLATGLVVLSACETGLGEIRTGEGVFGLRRAFVLAGAKTLVMSLWKVPDQETQELMEDFYRRVLQGKSRADALREAQLAIRTNHPDPLYWGAFICQGDPSPLSGVKVRENRILQAARTDEVDAPARADELRRRGEKLSESGEHEAALDYFDSGLQLQPDDLNLLDLRASVLLQLGRDQEALGTIDYVLENDLAAGRSLGYMYAAKGHALTGMGENKDALYYYRKSLDIVTDESKIWYMQGYALHELRKHEAALDSLKQAQGIEDNEDTRLVISYCYMSMEEYSKAEQEFRGMLERGSSNPFVYHGLGLILIQLEEMDEGCQWLQRSLDSA
ncbi:unnamed protein product, partial [marine sediment metagenome]